LPSIRYLAKELRVSVTTVKRTYDELKKGGFINFVQGTGSFVSMQNQVLIQEEQLKKVEAFLSDVIKDAQLARLSIEDLKDRLDTLEGLNNVE